MSILVTGAAGFIGSELSIKLLQRGETVIGIDNHNDYYDPDLKENRLARHIDHTKYTHIRMDIAEATDLGRVFSKYKPKKVVNLAAQVGVRYSIENPHAYIQSNIIGFMNILEACRHNKIEHLVYASSSSVYGANIMMPFSANDNVDHPLSIYAASKKSNELMAHSYSHLYSLPCTGLRFFTVYGPWGRPDMAPVKFAKGIMQGSPIQVYNYGKHKRDFTYIDDIVDGVLKVIDEPPQSSENFLKSYPCPSKSKAPWRIYNIGNGNPVDLMVFINTLEKYIGKKANLEFLPLQPGDVEVTSACMEDFCENFKFKSRTNIDHGIRKFIDWSLNYHGGL